MIHLKNQTVKDEYYKYEPIEGLIRIQKALFEDREIYMTLDECGNLWQNYSWALSASWLYIPEQKYIVSSIESSWQFESYKKWASVIR